MLGRGFMQLGVDRGGYGSVAAIASRHTTFRATRKLVAPFPSSPLRQFRAYETELHTPSSASNILIAQRKLRPVSPHLSIYRMQINYFTSPFHRVTGVFLSGTFYFFGLTYLVAPAFGWHFDSSTLVEAFAGLNEWVKLGAKGLLAFPFTFHAFNGVGHLIWDTGRRFSTKAIVRQGWTVVGLSLAAAGYLASL